ncbi:MAG: hypothetical protein AAFV59_10155 [Pseudomonadota bacterium]
MIELRSELEDWCASYVRAFCDYDADAIAAHWTFPALTTQAGRSFSFASREHFSKNTDKLLGFYQRQGVSDVTRSVIACHALHPDVASMTVSDVMRSQSREEIVSWTAAYVLQRTGGIWKAVMAVADGETQAWAARGTPLVG